MEIKLSAEDIEWLITQYPKLQIDTFAKTITGDIDFTRSYEGYEISDSYTIQIILEASGNSMLPKVHELSNKIAEMAKRYKMELIDLHINTDRSFCTVIQDREHELFEDKFTIQEFMKKALEPFLFAMSYFDKEGRLPWGEYAHGYLGHLELFAEGGIDLERLLELLEKKELAQALLTNRQSRCLCGSGKKLRKCHPFVFRGINKLKVKFKIGECD
ncbi:SEC-C domain-containing protein [Sulfurimonas sp. HSL-1656]|uniref:SEC-C domain-containing protein n=1 Tax=Thiomicrolovo subterrani TaxID=3131934 RepID=UPI0031F9A632